MTPCECSSVPMANPDGSMSIVQIAPQVTPAQPETLAPTGVLDTASAQLGNWVTSAWGAVQSTAVTTLQLAGVMPWWGWAIAAFVFLTILGMLRDRSKDAPRFYRSNVVITDKVMIRRNRRPQFRPKQ